MFLIFLYLLNMQLHLPVGAQKAEVVNVRKYGAVGDGVADDYQAILAAVKIINEQGTGELYFPKGKYFIEPYHMKAAQVRDIFFQECKNLVIRGDQAVIIVNGAFMREVDDQRGKHSYSQTSSIIPFVFKNCHNLSITGLEIMGQVNLMHKEKGLTESGGHLMTFNNCTNVRVSDVYVHHGQTDGIYIGNQNKDFIFSRVRSANNARQGMSVIELSNGRFEACMFTGTGFTGGDYGGHNPKAGVDIEPSAHKKQIVQQLVFDKCTFSGNAGPQFVCSKPSTTSAITLDSCIISAGKGKYAYQLILTAKNLLLKNSQIDLGKGSIYPVWGKYSGSDVQIINCSIKGSGKGIVAVSADPANKVLIQGNHLMYTGSTLTTYFPYLQMANLKFLDNQVDIPAETIREGKITSLVQKGEISSGNVFKSGHKRIVPRVSYQGTKKVND